MTEVKLGTTPAEERVRERAKKILPIYQAFADGKTVQYRRGDEPWRDYNPVFSDHEYRIKPEPREFWVVVDRGTGDGWVSHSKEIADRAAQGPRYEVIRVREVVES